MHIVSPFGSGKTTFGMALCIYASAKEDRGSLFLTGNDDELKTCEELLSRAARACALSSEQLARIHISDLAHISVANAEQPDIVFLDEAHRFKVKARDLLRAIANDGATLVAADSYIPTTASSIFGGRRLARIKIYGVVRRIDDYYFKPKTGYRDATLELLEALGPGGAVVIYSNTRNRSSLIKDLKSKGYRVASDARWSEIGDVLFPERLESSHSGMHVANQKRYALSVGIPRVSTTKAEGGGKGKLDVRKYLLASSLASPRLNDVARNGLSVVIVEDDVAIDELGASLRYDCALSFNPIDIPTASKIQQDSVQGTCATTDEGRSHAGRLRHALVIVESPTKATTICNFINRAYSASLGPVRKNIAAGNGLLLEVIATGGHLTDLSLSEGFHGVIVGTDSVIPVYSFIRRCRKCGRQFNSLNSCPTCGSKDFADKGEVVRAIRQAALATGQVILATDPDTEGEKIAWDLYTVVKPFNPSILRAEFHEVTRHAFEDAINSSRDIASSLVDAQISRRVEDRWIGFELSKRLWRQFARRTLSAGRAQSPILNWVVTRTKENKERLTYAFITLENGIEFRVSEKDIDDVRSFVDRAKEAKAKVEELSEGDVEMQPPPPYSTDGMLRDASFLLKMSSSSAMRAAQRLFELGLISYHRTDSVRISPYGLAIARSYIEKRFGSGYYRGRPGGETGAHEAIRATRSYDTGELLKAVSSGQLRLPGRLGKEEIRLYELIFKRFIASQMKPAKVKIQKIKVKLDDVEIVQERRVGLVDDGFMKLLPRKFESRIEGGEYAVNEAKTRRLPKAWLFTEGELVSWMRERGIGRPSTYAKLIETILRRRYAFSVNGRLISTDIGQMVNQYLQSRYIQYVSEETSRELERKMKSIEEGTLSPQKFLSDLYEEIRKLP